MLSATDLTGLLPAIVTPFTADNALDKPALTRLVDRMFDGGAKGIVPMGGTGEFTALSPTERRQAIEWSVEAAAGRGPVVAGVLSPGLAEAIATARDFKAAGADAIMLLTPFYAIGAQAGLMDWIRRVRQDVDIPIVLYEIPARTNVSLAPETIARLAEEGTAIGIKYSNYDVPRFARVASMVGDDFALLSGEEPLSACHLMMGARGAVLATANLFPRYWSELFKIAEAGDYKAAFAHQYSLQPLLDAVFAEANPGPLKRAMEMIGEPVGRPRLPLQPPSDETEHLLHAALQPLRSRWAA